MPDPLLALRGLDVRFRLRRSIVHAVKGIDLDVHAGETVALLGDAGSGKSQLALAVMGVLPANGRATGSVRFHGTELLGLPPPRLERIRGARIGMLPQEATQGLDPLLRIGEQLAESFAMHGRLDRDAARRRAQDLLEQAGLAQAVPVLDAYPHDLSESQRQRVAIALALAGGPDLLIADAPAARLDVTQRVQVLGLLRDLRARLGMALLLLTRDPQAVRGIADRLYVMQGGELVEAGSVAGVFARPAHAGTRALLAEPQGRKPPPPEDAAPLLEAGPLSVRFHVPGGADADGMELRAVDRVSLTLHTEQTIGIVGESGSGKSVLGRALLQLLPSEGRIRFRGRDVRTADAPHAACLRRELQLLFPDPRRALSPARAVGDSLGDVLRVHAPSLSPEERDDRIAATLREVEVDPALRHRHPRAFTVAELQRIAIARAIIPAPRIIVLDEPTLALDRAGRIEIASLLRRLQEAQGLSYLLISEDLALVRALADEVIVMRGGKVVERGAAQQVLGDPKHPYTQAFVAASFGDPSER